MMPSIELYWAPGSCARVPFIALEHVGAPFELRVVNRYLGDLETTDYRAISPKGKVPALVLDGIAITENPVIQTVLARTFPDAGLLPRGDERVVTEAMSMMVWFASDIHPAIARQRHPRLVSDGDEASLQRIRLVARKELEKAFAILEARLADRDWLFEDWSIIDAYMLWLWFRAVGAGMDPAPFPRCADHARRNESRDAVARVLDREEAEFTGFQEAGTVPATQPPFAVGRVPIVGSGSR
jgi:glutathione S-transferase